MSNDKKTGVERLWEKNLPTGSAGIAWLGQAGFAVRAEGRRWLIDPYLSDHLAKKYRDTEFSHERLMPSPVQPDQLSGLDWIFCTHRHSDHMDPGSLPVLAETNPSCRFVVPRAEREAALKAGVPSDRIEAINVGESLTLSDTLTVTALAAAHETLKTNERGEHYFLGFIFKTPDWVIYHSGDCVPYQGLVEELCPHNIDIALLPVNGRDSYRASRGFAGNFTFAEARQLCAEAQIPMMVAQHFGMFAFNTLATAELQSEVGKTYSNSSCLLPNVESYFWLKGRPLRQVIRS